MSKVIIANEKDEAFAAPEEAFDPTSIIQEALSEDGTKERFKTMRDTPSFSITLCGIISRLLCLTGVTSADKSQTNITIAFLGPYLAYPGVRLNGSLVTAYPTFASNIVRYNGVTSSLGLAIWCDIGAQIAVDMINKSPNILPNATIIVKRFNDLDPVFSRSRSGYGMQVAMKIQEEHPVENDVSVTEIIRIGNLLEYYDIRFVWRCISTIITHDV
ncbi:hypothetical protein HDU79_006432 [Rhizoclosmatium sp. JEL0117]|nr:hypothetical protein HDU79_006432 [Rhizoclosmatium sp. JEL0117]